MKKQKKKVVNEANENGKGGGGKEKFDILRGSIILATNKEIERVENEIQELENYRARLETFFDRLSAL
jgi:hypothetical protein